MEKTEEVCLLFGEPPSNEEDRKAEWAGVLAQLVKCLPPRPEHMSAIPPSGKTCLLAVIHSSIPMKGYNHEARTQGMYEHEME